MKNIILRIKGTQNHLGGKEDTIEFITEGKYYDRDNAKYLVYEESELSGMEGCTTTLKLQDDKIIMRRYGRAASELVFQKGKRYTSNYSTPYGNFRMEILTKELQYNIDNEAKGNILVKYEISLQGLKEGINDLNIEINPIENKNKGN